MQQVEKAALRVPRCLKPAILKVFIQNLQAVSFIHSLHHWWGGHSHVVSFSCDVLWDIMRTLVCDGVKEYMSLASRSVTALR